MDEDKEKSDLSKIGGPDRVEIVPGLVLEDKIRIKTQRKLEKRFDKPIARIFPGKAIDPITKELVAWEGVDFNFINNAIPLITILAQQVDETITEGYIEDVLDGLQDQKQFATNLEKLFSNIVSEKNLKGSNQTSK